MNPFKTLLAAILVAIPFLLDAQNFEGVWHPTENKVFGNMKIRKTDNGYLVQIKHFDEILSAEVQPANGALSWSVLDKKNYGSWWIGTCRGKDKNILVGHDDGYSYGTNGEATKIYDNTYRSRQRCANIEEEYMGIKIEPSGEDLIVSWCLFSSYLANGRVVFMQSSNWIPIVYTNW